MKNCEKGHTLLYTTVFIPLVLGSAALAFDVSGVNLKAERSERYTALGVEPAWKPAAPAVLENGAPVG